MNMYQTPKRLAAGVLALAVLSSQAMLTAQADDAVVVASKIDTEGAVLGQLIAQTLERHDIPVEKRLQLGGTSVVRGALLAGEIDLYPEYTGNGAFFFDMTDSPVWNNAEEAFETVKQRDAENDLVWLSPASANNTWAMSVRGDVAEAHDLQTLEDLADYLADGGEFKFAASTEFVESEQALPAFQSAYGFELDEDQLLVLSGGNTAATMRAAAQQTSGVNAAMTYGTDGGLSALGLVVLEDSLGVQPVYQPAPVIREEALDAYPQIEPALNEVFATLDLETLQRLNADVAVNGLSAETVAADYLDALEP
ncbi:ABC transporter substrate-binding protein [Halomonas sp. TBZ9]|uniref:ABC transporter substrate-binding protein n=2 Tax=Vreelandella azerica TaxID=2732867 RepID=A0A7Y3TYS2_9GAMM|nr:ABC transporter substrate-binding protein [Halomonas azerica]